MAGNGSNGNGNGDDRAPWERQAGETARKFHAFAHYRDMGASRSVDKAWAEHVTRCKHEQVGTNKGMKRRSGSWGQWASTWGWTDRCIAWDNELDRQTRQRLAKAQVEARERHARLAQGTLTALSAPVRAMLEALADPKVVQQLTTQVRGGNSGAMYVLNLVGRVAQAMPALVTVERLALGMSTEYVETDERHEVTLAQRIVSDPEATDLAIQLLDRLAHTQNGGTDLPVPAAGE